MFPHGIMRGLYVYLVVKGSEEDPEELPQVHVVWSFLEPEAPAIVEIHGELCGEALAKHLHRGRHLLLTNLLVLKKNTRSCFSTTFISFIWIFYMIGEFLTHFATFGKWYLYWFSPSGH